MKFEGTEQFDCTRDELWARLADTSFVARVIPDVERIERVEPLVFTCRVRPRFSFLTGSLELKFELIDPMPPERLTVRSTGKGIGAAVVVEAELLLESIGSKSALQWSSTIVAREGLFKPVSPSLIQGAAQRVISKFWEQFRAALPNDDSSPVND